MWPCPPLTNANFHNRISGYRTQYPREIFYEREINREIDRDLGPPPPTQRPQAGRHGGALLRRRPRHRVRPRLHLGAPARPHPEMQHRASIRCSSWEREKIKKHWKSSQRGRILLQSPKLHQFWILGSCRRAGDCEALPCQKFETGND